MLQNLRDNGFDGRVLEISLIGEQRRPVNPRNGGLAGFNRWVYLLANGALPEDLRRLRASLVAS